MSNDTQKRWPGNATTPCLAATRKPNVADHDALYRVAAPAFDVTLAATLHRLDIRIKAFLLCHPEFSPMSASTVPEEVA